MSIRKLLTNVRLLLEEITWELRSSAHREQDASTALQLTQLEQRLLYSASPVAAVAQLATEVDATGATEAAFSEPAPLSDAQLLDIVGDALPTAAQTETTQSTTAAQTTLQLVFVDAALQDLDQVLDSLQQLSTQTADRALQIIVLNPERDGLAQITAALLEADHVDSIHVISQGDATQVRLGSSELSLETLDRYRTAISAWQSAWDPSASTRALLFYGTPLTESADGRQLLQELGSLTSAHTSASAAFTGQLIACQDAAVLTAADTVALDTAARPVSGQQVVLIDTQLEDSTRLLQSVAPDSQLFVYDSTQDAAASILQRIAAWAQETSGSIDSLSILSRGTHGGFELGSTWFTTTTLPTSADAWGDLAAFFSDDAQIQIFGSHVASADSDGRLLIEQLSLLTGADVFASDDLTGSGGDWLLEVASTSGQAELAAGLLAPLDGQQTRTVTAQLTSTQEVSAALSYNAESIADNSAAGTVVGSLTTQEPDADTAEHTLELVFLDASIENLDQMQADLLAESAADPTRTLEFIVLDADQDGIAQITSALLRYQGVDSLHLVSHGGTGQVQLGSTWLNMHTLETYRTAIQAWQQALSDSADILFYGCNLAGSADGRQLLQELSLLTGSDVAASEDSTGGALRNADWDLEFQIGTITTDVAFSSEFVASADFILATYTVTNTNDSGAGSLRQAIIDANNNAGADTITFSISGTGVHTINLASSLTITGAVTIDATTDDSFAANGNRPAIILDGNNSFTGDGFVLTSTADGTTIRGFVIRDFSGDAIEIQAGSDNNLIAGNYIGRLTATGTDAGSAETNTGHGIHILGANNTIGGTTAADRNVIAGNTVCGVYITGASATGNVVAGNYIGLLADGTTALANNEGVQIFQASSNTIGGATTAHRNIISGNTSDGVQIWTNSHNNVVQNNYIGTDATGTLDRGNSNDGIDIDTNADNTQILNNLISGNNASGINLGDSGTDSSGTIIQGNYIGTQANGTSALGNSSHGIEIGAGGTVTSATIGGTTAGQGNIIANNGLDGVFVSSGGGVVILGNSIYGNTGIGIDLGTSGVTANDSGDGDTGANSLQNFPVVDAAVLLSSQQLRLDGSLNSLANTNFRIDFYSSTSGDSTGYGEGQTHLGFVNVLTNGSGNATFATTLTGAFTAGHAVTATATRLTAGLSPVETSEFAANVTLTTEKSLWVSSTGTATTSAGTGALLFNDAHVARFGDPNLTLGSGTANGWFSSVVDFDGLAGDGNCEISGLHWVSRSITIGTTNPVTLQRGDILFSTAANETFGGTSFFDYDIIRFRPDTEGDYSSGTYSLVLRNPGNPGNKIKDFALVENAMTVGGTSLQSGDFLVVLSSSAYDKDINLFRPTNMGSNPTGGTLSMFIDGSSTGVGFGQQINGLELVQGDTTLGGSSLTAGQLLVSLAGSDTIGTNNLSVTTYDTFALTVTATGTSTSSASAAMFLRGSDVGISAGGEQFDALALVNAYNFAPTLDSSKSPAFTAINEDAGAPSGAVGTLVSALVDFASPSGQVDNISDSNYGPQLGIAVVGSNTANGSWWYSTDGGTNWSSLGSVSNSSARLLAADSLTRLYFQPNADWNGTISDAITFRAWDQTTGSSGSLVNTSTNGGTTAFSTATDTASLTVNAVNDAPVLDNSGTLTLTTITEDQTTNGGQTVASIITSAGGDRITDVDSGAVEGVAITATSSGNGTWQYSTNGGGVWTNVGSVSATSALLLRSTDLVRFVPDSQNGTTANFTFRAWDQTSGATGTKVDVSVNGGITAFSTATETASITVTSVNDAPFMPGVALGSTNEDSTITWTVSSFAGFSSDVDTGALQGLAIVGVDDTNGTWQYTLNGSTWFNISNASTSNALLLKADATSAFRFVPNADWNGTTGMLQYKAWDQTSGTAGTYVDASTSGGTTAFSGTSGSVLTVNAVNDAPVITVPASQTVAEDDSLVFSSGNGNLISFTDVDAASGSMLLTLSVTNGTLTLSTTAGLTLVSGGNGTGAMQYTGTLTNLNAALSGMVYTPTVNFNGSVGMGITVGDQGNTGSGGALSDSKALSITVTAVNDAPVLDNSGTLTLTTITEDQTTNGGQTVASIIASAGGDRITDVDSGAVEGIAVSATTNGNGSWEYSTNGGSSWNSVGAVSGSSALLLRSTDLVRFVPNGQNATAADITFRAWDQTTGTAGTKVDVSSNGATTSFSTATETAAITVTSVNDAPTIPNGYTHTLTGTDEDTTSAGTLASAILTGASWADVDSAAVSGLAITAATGNGTWQYSTDGSTWNSFGAVSSTNALLITSSTQVRYVPDGNNGETATFTYKAWDQTSGTASTNATPSYATTASSGGTTAFSSNNASAQITVTSVNDAPTITNGYTHTLTGTDEDATSSGTLASTILTGTSWADVDSAAVSGLAITAATGNGTWQYSTDGSTWNGFGAVSSTNALLITSSTQVRYLPDGNNGETATFTYKAWDQTSGTASTNATPSYATTASSGGTTAFSSNNASAQITITAVNDAPTITNGYTHTLTGTSEDTTSAGTLASTILTGASWADVDSAAVSGLAITAATGNGTWQYSTDGSTWNGFGAVSSTNALLITSSTQVRYVPDGNNGETATFTYKAWDQTSGTASTNATPSYATTASSGGITAFSSNNASAQITITSVNDAPLNSAPGSRTVITGNSLTFSGTTSSQISISDVDAGTSAVQVSLTATNGTMSLSGTSGLSFAVGDGVSDTLMTFTGTISDLNTALNNLVFTPTSAFVGTATLQISTSDLGNSGSGGTQTDVDLITINVIPRNSASLWLTTDKSATTSSGVSWTDGEIINLSTPSLSFEPGTTSGTFTSILDLDAFAADGNSDVSAIHRVTETVVVGSGGNSMTLQAGDVLFSVTANETFGGVAVTDKDLVRFRPTVAGNYSSGTFAIVLNSPTGDKIREVALVERTTVVGGVTLNAGDFLLVQSSATYDKDVWRFQATGVGNGTTSGILTELVDGADLGNSQQIGGLALIQRETNLGGVTLQAGQLLMSIRSNGDVGSNSLAVTEYDIFILDVTSAGTSTVANATLLFQGSDVALSSGGEQLHGLSLVVTNYAPTLSGANALTSVSEDDAGNTGTLVSALLSGHVSDLDAGAASGVAVVAVDDTHGTWQFSQNGGSSWTNFGSVSASAARLLGNDAGTRIRFVPHADWNGTSSITLRAWDQTEGMAGGTFNITSPGGTSAFSSATASSSIVVTPVNDEQVLATNTGLTVNENSAGNTIDNTALVTTDVDHAAGQLTYTITSATTSGMLRRSGAALSVGSTLTQADIDAGLITYDHDGSETSSDSFAFSVDDGLGSASTGTFNIAVTPVNDNSPVITSDGGGATAAINVAENTTAVTTVTATDMDLPSQTLTYSITGGADANLFAIDSNTGVLTFVSGRNREAHTDADLNGIYDVTVRVSDGSLFDSQNISVTITDVDEFDVTTPVDANPAANSVAENAANGTAVGITAQASDADATNNTITWSLTDNAGGRFAIDAGTGVVTVADGSLLDRETAAAHSITVRATSADGSTADTTFNITLSDVDEFNVTTPVDANPAANSVAENAANGTTVGVTAAATDADATNNTITWSLTDNAGGRFAIDAGTGVVTVADGSLLDRETAAAHSITVRATSTDGSTADTTFNITVTDVPEYGVTPPADNDTAANVVAENAANGTTVGVTAAATDADATDTITYTLTDSAGGRFTIDASTGIVTVADGSLLDRETAAAHSITVRATSTDGSTADTTFNITVTDVNEFNVTTPIDSDGTADTVAENATSGTTVGITGQAADGDATNNTITWSLTDNAGGRFAIDASTGIVTVADGSLLDREAAAAHSITVRATSADGSTADTTFIISLSDVDEFNVTTPVDANPAANSVAENAANGTAVGITAQASDADATNNTITWSLTHNAGGRFAIDAGTGVVTVADGSLLDRETTAAHSITVRATSANGSTADTTFNITLSDVDDFNVTTPVDANPAANSVAENAANGTAVGITAQASDADATNNTVTWSLTDNAGGRFAIDAGTGVVTVADGSLLDRETAAAHSITVRATSTDGSTADTTFNITLSDVDEFNVTAPADSDAAANSVAENAANGTAVGITAQASDADATNNTITWSLTDNAGGRFAIDAGTGVVTVADGSLLDRETAAAHSITVRATSADGSTADTTFNITLSDVDEFNVTTPVDANPAANSVAENAANGTAVGITAQASDADATNNTITWSLTDNAGGRFAIDAGTGVVTVADGSLLDRETAAAHSITVRATSADGSTADTTFIISLSDVDEFDVGPISDGNPVANGVDENAAPGTLTGITATAVDADATATVTWSLLDDAGGRFAIDAQSGVVSLVTGLDYESATSHTITIRATSSDGSVADLSLQIAVHDQNDNPPVVTPGQVLIINENSASGTSAGFVLATDADGVGSLQSWAITGGNPGNALTIDAATGELRVSNSLILNFEQQAQFIVTITVSDGVATSAAQDVVIRLADVNEQPVLADPGQWTLPEHAAVGTIVGSLSATDVDAGDTLTYAILSGTPGQPFSIDSVTGQMRVADPAALDFETVPVWQLLVQVSDAAGLQQTRTLTVQLTNINEAPAALSLSGGSIAENSTAGSVVGSMTGQDPDAGDTLTWSLTSDADGRFAIDAFSGQIFVTNSASLDFEQAATHSLLVRGTDAGGLYRETWFSIALTNVNEAPTGPNLTWSGPQLEPIRGGTGALLTGASDPEGDPLFVSLVSGPTSGALTVNADGSFTYVPHDVFTGTDTFSYVISDGTLTSSVRTVTLQVLQTISGSSDGPTVTTGSSGSGSSSSDSQNDDSSSALVPGGVPQVSETNDSRTAVTRRSASSGSDAAAAAVLTTLPPGAGTAGSDGALAESSGWLISVFLDAMPDTTELRSASRDTGRSVNTDRETPAPLFGGDWEWVAPEHTVAGTQQLSISMEQFTQQTEEQQAFLEFGDNVVVGTSAVVSTSLSVGYVIWILRGGSLLTAFMSSLPAWQNFDPLPVLDSFDRDRSREDEESLASLVNTHHPQHPDRRDREPQVPQSGPPRTNAP